MELIFGGWFRSNNFDQLNILRSRKIPINVSKFYKTKDPIITYTRDDYGLRGSFGSPDEIDVLTIGGSTTDQRYINDGATWQDIAQDIFKVNGKKVIFGNAGIDGQSTVGHISNFQFWFPYIPNLKPKYILFYIGLNDFNLKGGNKYDDFLSDKNSLKSNFKQKSIFYREARILKGLYEASVSNLNHASINFSQIEWTKNGLQNSYEELMKDRSQQYGKRLQILTDKVRRFGSEPIFVTQPSRWFRRNGGEIEGVTTSVLFDKIHINGIDYYNMMNILNSKTCEVAKKNNILCFDMAQEINLEDSDFYDFVHNTPNGARKIGEYIYQKMDKVL